MEEAETDRCIQLSTDFQCLIHTSQDSNPDISNHDTDELRMSLGVFRLELHGLLVPANVTGGCYVFVALQHGGGGISKVTIIEGDILILL